MMGEFDHLKLKRLLRNCYEDTQYSGVTRFLIPMAMMKKKSYPLNFQKPTAKVITYSFTNSQSPNCWKSHLQYDSMRADITISHDEVL